MAALVHLVCPLAGASQTRLGNPRYEALWMSSTSDLGGGRDLDWGEAGHY